MSDQTTALATQTGAALAPDPDKQLAFSDKMKAVIRKTVASGIKDDIQYYTFIAYCERAGFDPLKREIYGYTDKTGKLVMMVGIDGFRRKAREQCDIVSIGYQFLREDGTWLDYWVDRKNPPVACKCSIIVRGASGPIESIIYYDEFNMPHNPNWQQKPRHMLMLRAEAHCLRKLPQARNLADLELADPGDPIVARIEETPAPALAAGSGAPPVQYQPYPPQEEPEEAEVVPPGAETREAAGRRQAETFRAAAPPPFVAEPPQGTPPPPVTPRTSGQVQPRTRAINLYRTLGGDPANEAVFLQHLRWVLGTPTLNRLGAVTPAEWERVAEFLDRERRLPTEEDAALEAEMLEETLGAQVPTPTLGLED